MKHKNTARYIAIGVLLATIVIIAGVISWIIYWANQPSVTTINTAPIPTTQTLPEPVALTTPFFTTFIPAGYKIQNNSNPNNPLSIQVLAYTSANQGTNIGFTSSLLPTDGIYGVADYKLRRSEGSGYTLLPPDGLRGAEYVFRKTSENPEMTAFVVHNDRYLTIAITGGTESLQAEQLQQIITSLSWTQ